MTKLSRICTFLVCALTSGTWLTQAAYGQALLPNAMPTTSGLTTQLRAPNGSSAAMRAVTIIRASEATALGATNTVKSFGFNLQPVTLPNDVTGTVNIYMLNTADATYLKGANWTTAITGMTQVCTNCAFNIPAAGATFYDIPLTTNFAYTGGGIYVAYDFTITSTLLPTTPTTSPLVTYLANNVLTTSLASFQGAIASNTLGATAFRPEMRLTTDNPFTTDNIVANIIAPGKMPVGSPSAFNQIKSTILNRGSSNATNLSVTLTVSGANSFTNTKVVPSIVAGQDATVTFDAFVPTVVGTNNVVVSVAADNNPNPNNSLNVALETTCGTFSYANNAPATVGGGIGFNTGSGLLLNKFKTAAASSVTVSGLNITISDDANTPGKTIGAVLASATGILLARSADYTVLSSDLGTVRNFTFATPITIPAGAAFFAGLVQVAGTPGYFPLASQTIASPAGFIPAQANIVPVETDVLFAGGIAALGATVSPALQSLTSRLMIDVITNNIVFSNTTATNGAVGAAYSLNAGAVSTSGALSYTVSPALPAGLSINPTSGLISGTPSASAASAIYTVTATSNAGACSATQTYTFLVSAANCTPVVVGPAAGPVSFVIGTAITNITLSATGGNTGATYTYNITAGALPAGLVLTNGVISGTPTTVGTGTFTINATSTPGPCVGSAVYTFTVANPACSGAPAASNVVSSAASVCSGVSFNLSLSTTYPFSGIGYQWQSAPTLTGTYTNIAGATSSTYSATQTAATAYRVLVSCSNFTTSTTSTAINVGINSAAACLVYCAAAVTNPADSDIGRVVFGTLANGTATPVVSNPAATGTYTNFTSVAAPSVGQGASIPLSLSQITSGPTFYGAKFAVYIDYNQDGDFLDADELVFSSTAPTSAALPTQTATVVIPTTATLGITRMRVLLNEATMVTPVVPPCNPLLDAYGEVEDYFINIVTCPLVVVTPASGAVSFTVGTAIPSITLGASGVAGTGTTYAYTITAGALPAGLTLTAGVISGTPTTIGTGTFTITATSTPGSCTGTAVYTFTVCAPVSLTLTPAPLTLDTLAKGTVGVAFSQTFAATGVTGSTYTYALTGTLPAGLSFASTAASATITGTPTAAGTVTIVVRATSNLGCISPATNYKLVIRQGTSTNNALSNSLRVYPNPFTNDFNVDFGGLNISKATVRVYDAQGKKVFASDIKTNLMTISLGKMATGIYLLEVETTEGRVVKKLAKQ